MFTTGSRTKLYGAAGRVNIAFGVCIALGAAIAMSGASRRIFHSGAVFALIGIAAGGTALVVSGVRVGHARTGRGTMARALATGLVGAGLVAAAFAGVAAIEGGHAGDWGAALAATLATVGIPAGLAGAVMLVGADEVWRPLDPPPVPPTVRSVVGGGVVGALFIIGLVLGAVWLVSPHRSGRTPGDEWATIGSLRSLCTAQEQFKQQCIVDQDGDGRGEYGWLGELAGVDDCRGPQGRMNVSPFLAAILGVKNAGGLSQKSGYHFVLYLPGPDGRWVREGFVPEGTEAPTAPAAADAQEAHWICYAWPTAFGHSGRRAFMATEAGDIYVTPNTGAKQQYSGTTRIPAPDAAFTAAGGIGLAAAGLTAGDGGEWQPAGN